MESIILIKLGGSIITDKTIPYTPNIPIIKELANVLTSVDKPLIIAHGSGSFGHTSAQLYGGKKGYTSKEGIAKLCFDASWINHIVMDVLIKKHLPAVSLRPMSMMQTNSGILTHHLFENIEELLKQKLIPVVYGDVMIDTSWNTTIFSGEKILSEIADYLLTKSYFVEKVIEIGNTDGFYDKEKKTVKKITPETWENLKNNVFETNTPDVTGGMIHKVEEALLLVKKGIPTYLVNGNNSTAVKDALLSSSFAGTRISTS